jgi:hypothetical protein
LRSFPSRFNGKTWQARAEEILFVGHHALRSDAVTGLHHLKMPLPTVERHQDEGSDQKVPAAW